MLALFLAFFWHFFCFFLHCIFWVFHLGAGIKIKNFGKAGFVLQSMRTAPISGALFYDAQPETTPPTIRTQHAPAQQKIDVIEGSKVLLPLIRHLKEPPLPPPPELGHQSGHRFY